MCCRLTNGRKDGSKMAWSEYETLHPVSDDPDIQRALDGCETVVLFHEPDGDFGGDDGDEYAVEVHGTYEFMGERIPLNANLGVWDNPDGARIEGCERALELMMELRGRMA